VPTDAALVEAYRDRRDEDAFAELVRRYRDPVFRLAASILGPSFVPEAEEVVQDVFVRVHHAIASFRGEAQFGSWIYRIAFNQAINRKSRLRYRVPHVSEETLRGHPSGGDALASLQAAQRDRAVADCIAELPEIYQAALRLHYWLETPVAESAELLGIPENTLKSYLHRARKLLHAMLKERGFGDV
jgi:RNA polymerase sigma-70 factor (ECF subfamily)